MGGDILILGGGFGGLEVATRLRSALDESFRITLADRRDFFSMGFTKFDVMFGRRQPEQCKSSYSQLEDRGIHFLQAEIASIDPNSRQIETSAGDLSADFLVVGLGVDLAPEATPGFLDSGGHTFYTFEGAQALYPVLQEFAEGRIVISIFDKPYQCPPAPYEGAFQLHHLFTEKGIRNAVQIDVLIPGPQPIPVSDTVSGQIEDLLGSMQIGLHKKHKVVEVDPAVEGSGHGRRTSSAVRSVHRRSATPSPSRHSEQPAGREGLDPRRPGDHANPIRSGVGPGRRGAHSSR